MQKISEVRTILRFHNRDVIVVKVIDVPQAVVGLHARAVLLLFRPALRLLNASELKAVAAHEVGHDFFWIEYLELRAYPNPRRRGALELRCDGLAVVTLAALNAPLRPLETVLRKPRDVQWTSRRVEGRQPLPDSQRALLDDDLNRGGDLLPHGSRSAMTFTAVGRDPRTLNHSAMAAWIMARAPGSLPTVFWSSPSSESLMPESGRTACPRAKPVTLTNRTVMGKTIRRMIDQTVVWSRLVWRVSVDAVPFSCQRRAAPDAPHADPFRMFSMNIPTSRTRRNGLERNEASPQRWAKWRPIIYCGNSPVSRPGAIPVVIHTAYADVYPWKAIAGAVTGACLASLAVAVGGAAPQ